MLTGYAVFGYKGFSDYLSENGSQSSSVTPKVLYVTLRKREALEFKKESEDAFFIEPVQIKNPIFNGETIIKANVKILEQSGSRKAIL